MRYIGRMRAKSDLSAGVPDCSPAESQDDFLHRAEAAWQDFCRSRRSVSVEDVLGRLQAALDAKMAALSRDAGR